MLNHTGITVWLWQFLMGLNNDEFVSLETMLPLDRGWESCFLDLSSVYATTILLTSPSNILQQMGTDLNSQITKLLNELHFTYTFHDQNLHFFALKILLTRSSDVSNFAVTTQIEHWSKMSNKISPFRSVVCTQYRSLAFCILRVDPETPLICFRIPKFAFSTQNKYGRLM